MLAWQRGEPDAFDQLVPLVHAELRRLAQRYMQQEGRGHTLQATALVNEAYLRLNPDSSSWENRRHFFGAAAQAMRRILVDHARGRAAAKRGGKSQHLSLSNAADLETAPAFDVLAIDRALTHLAELDPDHARIVELKFFSGLSVDEIAHVLGRSPRTIDREWRLAKAWLYGQLSAG